MWDLNNIIILNFRQFSPTETVTEKSYFSLPINAHCVTIKLLLSYFFDVH